MSKIEVNAVEPQSGTTLTLGASGDTVALAAGATSTGFGETYNGAVNWDSTIRTSGFTAVDGGSVDNPVVSVSVSSPKRLKIVLTNAVAGKLRYGFSSWGGNLHNLCDINPSVARDLPMYQPGLIFEESFS